MSENTMNNNTMSKKNTSQSYPDRTEGAESVFADPVGYLGRLGLEAELVEVRVGELAPAA